MDLIVFPSNSYVDVLAPNVSDVILFFNVIIAQLIS